MHRFFLPDFQQPALSAEEAHHALNVLRLKTGDSLNVFDGRGHEAQCRIAEIAGNSVRLTMLQHTTTPPLRWRITLAQAIPKRNMELIVQKATELGVAVIAPLMSERTMVKLDDDSTKLSRWREIALEACKQSGNNWLPDIHRPQKAREFLNGLGKFDLNLVASLQPDAKPLKSILGADAQGHLGTVLLLIGPEGDFTPAELAQARSAGCVPLSLGPLVLRAETAALYALSILHHELQSA
jgi:16S rRNA (uracil1498-N3)-methyltransferase